MTLPRSIKIILGATALAVVAIICTTAYAIHRIDAKEEARKKRENLTILNAALSIDSFLTFKEKSSIRKCIVGTTDMAAATDCYLQKARPDLAKLSQHELHRYNLRNNLKYFGIPPEKQDTTIDCLNEAVDDNGLKRCLP